MDNPTKQTFNLHMALSAAAFATGVSAFLPIGLVYLSWLAFSALLIYSRHYMREADFHAQSIKLVITAIMAPPLLATLSVLIHGFHEQTATRLFHVYRNTFIIIVGLAISNAQRTWIWRGLVITGLAATIVILVHNAGLPLPQHPPFRDLFPGNGNASSQKMIMLATVAGCLFLLALQSTQWTGRVLYGIGWIMLSTTVAINSISRNSYLLLLTLPAAAIVYTYRNPKSWALSAALATGLAIFLWTTSDTVRIRTHQAIDELQRYLTSGEYSSSVDVRASMMTEAAKQMLTHPIIGTGTGSWLEYWRKSVSKTSEAANINNPHNDYLLAGMENGIPGLLALMGLIGVFIYINWKANNHWGGLGFITAISVGITAAVNAPFRDAAMGMALIWWMATCTRLPSNRHRHDTI